MQKLRWRSSLGFTLVELMIAISILVLITGGVFKVLSSSVSNNLKIREITNVDELQQQLQVVMQHEATCTKNIENFKIENTVGKMQRPSNREGIYYVGKDGNLNLSAPAIAINQKLFESERDKAGGARYKVTDFGFRLKADLVPAGLPPYVLPLLATDPKPPVPNQKYFTTTVDFVVNFFDSKENVTKEIVLPIPILVQNQSMNNEPIPRALRCGHITKDMYPTDGILSPDPCTGTPYPGIGMLPIGHAQCPQPNTGNTNSCQVVVAPPRTCTPPTNGGENCIGWPASANRTCNCPAQNGNWLAFNFSPARAQQENNRCGNMTTCNITLDVRSTTCGAVCGGTCAANACPGDTVSTANGVNPAGNCAVVGNAATSSVPLTCPPRNGNWINFYNVGPSACSNPASCTNYTGSTTQRSDACNKGNFCGTCPTGSPAGSTSFGNYATRPADITCPGTGPINGVNSFAGAPWINSGSCVTGVFPPCGMGQVEQRRYATCTGASCGGTCTGTAVESQQVACNTGIQCGTPPVQSPSPGPSPDPSNPCGPGKSYVKTAPRAMGAKNPVKFSRILLSGYCIDTNERPKGATPNCAATMRLNVKGVEKNVEGKLCHVNNWFQAFYHSEKIGTYPGSVIPPPVNLRNNVELVRDDGGTGLYHMDPNEGFKKSPTGCPENCTGLFTSGGVNQSNYAYRCCWIGEIDSCRTDGDCDPDEICGSASYCVDRDIFAE